jgi:hypothetical protein
MSTRVREIERFEVVGRTSRQRHTVVHYVEERLVTTIHNSTGSWGVFRRWLETANEEPVNGNGQLTLASTGEPLDRV